jgi:N-acetylglucosaminyldiphosphoundecaprenol N-acetyl-beta-D-mannosaminyltransferase
LYKPTIICTGAAIAFLTGRQATIPKSLDYLYLGWLSRCIFDPKRFVPRYISGFKLFNLIINTKVEKIL